MKIYRTNHNVVEDETIRHKDIPLSFLSNDSIKNNIRISINEEVARGKKDIPVMPYQEFRSYNEYLFDKDNNIVDTSGAMQRIGDTYYYIPENSIEYSPLRFNIKAIVKKKIDYKKAPRDYYMKIACIDTDYSLVNNLISAFGNAWERGICPNNIFVNNKDIAPESLINSNLFENDFVFIDTDDGIEPQENLYENLLKENVNIWLNVNNIENIIEDSTKPTIDFSDTPILYSNKNYSSNTYKKKIDTSVDITLFPKEEYEYINLFYLECPILLLKKENCGYVVISHKKLTENIGDHAKIIYEVLSYIFFNTYKNIKKNNIWISDNIVDKITGNESEHNLRHDKISSMEILKEIKRQEIEDYSQEQDIGNEYTIRSIEPSDQGVLYLGLGLEGTLMFKKEGLLPDPVKEQGMISVYTVRHTIINYKKNELSEIEEPIKINKIQDVFGDYIEILPIRSTYLKMNIIRSQTIEVPRNKQELILSYKEGVFSIIESFEEEVHGLKIADIKIDYEIEVKNYDVRSLGGGAIKGTQDNDYNLIDIGHIKGRPYRVGGCIVITLDKSLEQYKEMIQKEVNKHIIGGDLAILLFK